MTERRDNRKREFVERNFGEGSFYSRKTPIVFSSNDPEAKNRERNRNKIRREQNLPSIRILGDRELLEINEKRETSGVENPQRPPRRTRGKGRKIKPRLKV